MFLLEWVRNCISNVITSASTIKSRFSLSPMKTSPRQTKSDLEPSALCATVLRTNISRHSRTNKVRPRTLGPACLARTRVPNISPLTRGNNQVRMKLTAFDRLLSRSLSSLAGAWFAVWIEGSDPRSRMRFSRGFLRLPQLDQVVRRSVEGSTIHLKYAGQNTACEF